MIYVWKYKGSWKKSPYSGEPNKYSFTSEDDVYIGNRVFLQERYTQGLMNFDLYNPSVWAHRIATEEESELFYRLYKAKKLMDR